MFGTWRASLLLIVSLLVLASCATPQTAPPPSTAPMVTSTPIGASTGITPAAVAPTVAATEVATALSPTQAAPSTPTTDLSTRTAPTGADTVILVVVPESSQARYRVREQLAGFSLPSDAIGSTNAITGTIVGKMDGTIDAAQSKFVVDLRTLRSDQNLRDNFLRRNTLQTDRYPYATFVPTSAPGLPTSVPESGQSSFQLIGDLTIRDVTKSVTWDVTCRLESNPTEGRCQATTTFNFAYFNLTQPRVARVLSIEDKITLEVDILLRRVNP